MWRLWCQNLWCSQRRNTPAWLVLDHFKFALQISQDEWDTYRSYNRILHSFHELHHSEVDCWKILPRRSKWANASDCIECLSTQNTWKPNTHNPLGMWRWWCQNLWRSHGRTTAAWHVRLSTKWLTYLNMCWSVLCAPINTRVDLLSTSHLMKIEEKRDWSDRFQAFALQFTQREWDTVLVTWGWFITLLTEFHILFINFIILKSTAKRIHSRRSKWANASYCIECRQHKIHENLTVANFMNVKMVMLKPTTLT